MRAIDYQDWPQSTLRRSCGTVAYIGDDFDSLAAKLGAQPKLFTDRATRDSPRVQYRAFFFVLSNRAPGAIIQYLTDNRWIELLLPVVSDEFAFMDDYAEVVATLELNLVDRFDGNFTWLKDRKAKRVKPKDELPPEDWWGHFKVLSPEEAAKRRGFK